MQAPLSSLPEYQEYSGCVDEQLGDDGSRPHEAPMRGRLKAA